MKLIVITLNKRFINVLKIIISDKDKPISRNTNIDN